MTIDIGILIGIIGTVVAIVGTIYGLTKTNKKEIKDDTSEQTSMKADIKYIRKLTEDMVLEQRDANKTLVNHGERIIVLEQKVENISEDVKSLKARN